MVFYQEIYNQTTEKLDTTFIKAVFCEDIYRNDIENDFNFGTDVDNKLICPDTGSIKLQNFGPTAKSALTVKVMRCDSAKQIE